MAFSTEIITAAEVKSIALTNTTFDEVVFDKYIITAQRSYLRDAIGVDFYDIILDGVENANLSTENQELLDEFIKFMLAFFILFDAFPEIRNKITSQGIMINDTEFTEQSSREDFAAVRNAMIVQGERWKRDMLQFIVDKQDLDSSAFPDFNPNKDTYQNKKGFILY